MEKNGEYSLWSLWLAAYLLTNHVSLKRMDEQGNKKIFVFQNSPKLQELLVEFANNGWVRVKDYHDSVCQARMLTRRQEYKEAGNL